MVNSHIIPRHHLKQFANDAGCIFTYPDPDKHTDAQCISKGGGSVIKNTASQAGYYSEKIERILSEKFEYDGSQIAQKILDKQPISSDERELFVQYITSFIYRVPFTQSRMRELYSKVQDNMRSVEYYIEHYADKATPADYYEALNDPNHADSRIIKAWEISIEKEHQRIYDILLSREWWVAEVSGSEYFITSDNPLYYSISNGMVHSSIQITFPLSQKMALVFDGDLHTPLNTEIKYHTASKQLHEQVKLINQRTADNSSQLYSPQKHGYVQSLVGYQVTNPEYIRKQI